MILSHYLSGKNVLITTGQAKETIDGVRHFANHSRPIDHGKSVAKFLEARGATVKLISVNTEASQSLTLSQKSNIKRIISTFDLYEECNHTIKENDIDLIMIISSSCSLKSADVFEHKLKVKGSQKESIKLKVLGNHDLCRKIIKDFPNRSVIGFNNFQQIVANNITDDIKNALIELINDCLSSQPEILYDNGHHINIDKRLKGKKIIVTSGATAELLTKTGDIITNFSSGRQGIAIANELALMGAEVIMVSGKEYIPEKINKSVIFKYTPTARMMRECCFDNLPADVFIGVAAVADFGLVEPLDLQLKEGITTDLLLTQQPDILSEMGNHLNARPPMVVGFAAETNDILTYAKQKLINKRADVICANYVGKYSIERSHNQNQIFYITQKDIIQLDEMSKKEIGRWLGIKIAEFFSS